MSLAAKGRLHRLFLISLMNYPGEDYYHTGGDYSNLSGVRSSLVRSRIDFKALLPLLNPHSKSFTMFPSRRING